MSRYSLPVVASGILTVSLTISFSHTSCECGKRPRIAANISLSILLSLYLLSKIFVTEHSFRIVS